MNKCKVCGIEISGKATTCSARCRKILSRQASVTNPSVTLVSVTPEIEFEYVTPQYDLNLSQPKRKLIDKKVRKARYWYDVPIAAQPVIKKDWPKKPDYMNGRQYFLWWKNEFEENDKGPVILNPYPEHDKPIEYIRAAEGSRRLGA